MEEEPRIQYEYSAIFPGENKEREAVPIVTIEQLLWFYFDNTTGEDVDSAIFLRRKVKILNKWKDI